MNESFDPRLTDDAPSELALDAYVHGEAEPDEIAAVEAWMAADPAHAAIVEGRKAGFDALPEANPQAMLARIRLGLEAEAVEARAAEAGAARAATAPRFGFMQWLVGGLALAGAAAAILLFAMRPADTGIAPPDDTVLTKGTLKLQVFRARGSDVKALLPGDDATAGDRLRFKAENVPEGPGQIMVVGVEASGAVFPYYPAEGRSVAAHGTIKADGTLPGSAVLDASVGAEHVWLVWCPLAFALDDLAPGDEGLSTGDGCKVDGLRLEKK